MVNMDIDLVASASSLFSTKVEEQLDSALASLLNFEDINATKGHFYGLLELFRGHPIFGNSSQEPITSSNFQEFSIAYGVVLEKLSDVFLFQPKLTDDSAFSGLNTDLLTFTKEVLAPLLSAQPSLEQSCLEIVKATVLYYKKVVDFASTKIQWLKNAISLTTFLYGNSLQYIAKLAASSLAVDAKEILEVIFYLRDSIVQISRTFDNDGLLTNYLKFLQTLVLIHTSPPGDPADYLSVEDSGLAYFRKFPLPGYPYDVLKHSGLKFVDTFLEYIQSPFKLNLGSTCLTALLNLSSLLIRKRPDLIPMILPNYLHLLSSLEQEHVGYTENQLKSIRHSLKQQLTLLAKMPHLFKFKNLIDEALMDIKTTVGGSKPAIAIKSTPAAVRSILKRPIADGSTVSRGRAKKVVQFSEALVDERPEPAPRKRSPSPPPKFGESPESQLKVIEEDEEEDVAMQLEVISDSATTAVTYEKEKFDELERRISKKREINRNSSNVGLFASRLAVIPVPYVVDMIISSFLTISEHDIAESFSLQQIEIEKLRLELAQEKENFEKQQHKKVSSKDLDSTTSIAELDQVGEIDIKEGKWKKPTADWSASLLLRKLLNYHGTLKFLEPNVRDRYIWIQVAANISSHLLSVPEVSSDALVTLQDFFSADQFFLPVLAEDQDAEPSLDVENELNSLDERMNLALLIAYHPSENSNLELIGSVFPIIFAKLLSLAYITYQQSYNSPNYVGVTLEGISKRIKLGKLMRLLPTLPIQIVKDFLSDSLRGLGQEENTAQAALPVPLKVFKYQIIFNSLIDYLLYRDKREHRNYFLPLLLNALVSSNALLRKTCISLTYSKLFIRLSEMRRSSEIMTDDVKLSVENSLSEPLELERIIQDFSMTQLSKLLQPPPPIDGRSTEGFDFTDYTISKEDDSFLFSAIDSECAMESSSDAPWSMDQMALYLDNFFALCRLYPSFLLTFLPIYGSLTVHQQTLSRALLEPLIKALFDRNPTAFCNQVFLNREVLGNEDPTGLVLKMVHMLAKSMSHDIHPVLLSCLKRMVVELKFSSVFLIPVLHALEKSDVQDFLPLFFKDILDWSDDASQLGTNKPKSFSVHPSEAVIKDFIRKVISPSTKGALGPTELLIQIHLLEGKLGVKRISTLLSICLSPDISAPETVEATATSSPKVSSTRDLSMYEVFNYQVIASALAQLTDKTPLPSTLLKTVLLALSNYREKAKFFLQLLSKLVAKKVWTNDLLWEGFIRCCQVRNVLCLLILVLSLF